MKEITEASASVGLLLATALPMCSAVSSLQNSTHSLLVFSKVPPSKLLFMYQGISTHTHLYYKIIPRLKKLKVKKHLTFSTLGHLLVI